MSLPRAMILAAGRGSRLRPITDHTPKPLVQVGGRSLIDWRLEALALAGVREVVINIAWLGAAIQSHVGDGRKWGLNVAWSDEGERALETGGGIFNALNLLGKEPFIVCNADVWTDLDLACLVDRAQRWSASDRAHLVLVDNPAEHPQGDFSQQRSAGRMLGRRGGAHALTYAGLSVLDPRLLDGCSGAFALAPLLFDAASRDQLTVHHHRGEWCDVGTPQRLAELQARHEA